MHELHVARAATLFQDRSTHAVWERGGLFRLRPPPLMSSGAHKTFGLLCFSVWNLDLLFLVIFVSDNPLCLGFLQDFLNLYLLKVLSGPNYFPNE